MVNIHCPTPRIPNIEGLSKRNSSYVEKKHIMKDISRRIIGLGFLSQPQCDTISAKLETVWVDQNEAAFAERSLRMSFRGLLKLDT